MFVTRFAPSPTGYLHRGHAFSALTAYEAARAAGGRFILRIEDIDATRCRPEFEAAICEDLAWLGLAWESPVRRQSDHLEEYQAALARLEADGLLYRCFRTRREVAQAMASAPHGPMDAYRGAPPPPGEEARRLAAGQPFAWRLSLDAAERRLGGFAGLTFQEEGEGDTPARPELGGDVVLARKDVGVAYHLAVVVDDALQGITHVVRGRDLFHATAVHRLLQELLGLPVPAYHHHALILDEDGRKLSKSRGDTGLAALRAAGASPEDIARMVGLVLPTGTGRSRP